VYQGASSSWLPLRDDDSHGAFSFAVIEEKYASDEKTSSPSSVTLCGQKCLTQVVGEMVARWLRPPDDENALWRLLDPCAGEGAAARQLADLVGGNCQTWGVGKTTIALADIELLDAFPALVICPPHLVVKWQREAEAVIPGVQARILSRIGKLPGENRDVNSHCLRNNG
jgi:hypothetical protein